MSTTELLTIIWPLALAQICFQLYGVYDVARSKNTKHLGKAWWILICLICGVIGTICYFIFGRGEAAE